MRRRDDFLGHAQVTMNGEIWGIPEHGGGYTLAYNQQNFAEAGLADPWSAFEQGAWTYDTFVSDARRLTRDKDGDGQNDVFGAAGWYSDEQLRGAIKAFGGEMYSEDGRQMLWDSPEAIDAMRWVVELDSVYNVVGGDWADGTRAMTNSCPRCVFRDWATGWLLSASEDLLPLPTNVPHVSEHFDLLADALQAAAAGTKDLNTAVTEVASVVRAQLKEDWATLDRK